MNVPLLLYRSHTDIYVQCIQELCEEAFIESCFEELFEEEDQFAEELEQYLSSLTQEQVGNLVCQLDSVSLNDSNPSSSADFTTKVFSPLHCLLLDKIMMQIVCWDIPVSFQLLECWVEIDIA